MLSPNRIKIERLRLDAPRLSGALAGLKVVHLSDLHISRQGRRENKLVRLVNAENPDLILITGDLVVNYSRDFSDCVSTLRRLRARHGLFAVFGNAEHTFQPARVLSDFETALREVPVTVLNNRHVELKPRGGRLYLAGADDPFFQFDHFDAAVRGIPRGSATILLAHSPDILFPRADALTISLLDSPRRRDWFEGWGWTEATRYSPESGDVYFRNDGDHVLRVQTRQDGVALDTIVLNPYPEVDAALRNGDGDGIRAILERGDEGARFPRLVAIPASRVLESDAKGRWKKLPDPTAVSGFRLTDLPTRTRVSFQPLASPGDYFEAAFEARKSIRYHIWVRLQARRGSPLHDSVYVQFGDSLDERDRERYRIGRPAHAKDRLPDVDLILAGHTHGGQIRLPGMAPFATMATLGKRYPAGLFQVGASWLYVSRGVGWSRLPVRAFCPPEITVLQF